MKKDLMCLKKLGYWWLNKQDLKATELVIKLEIYQPQALNLHYSVLKREISNTMSPISPIGIDKSMILRDYLKAMILYILHNQISLTWTWIRAKEF